MVKRICKVEDCESTHEAKGYCHSHYLRWRRHGDPLIDKGPRPAIDRFMSRVQVASDGCWVWTGSLFSGTGYGQLWANRTNVQAHRFSYEHFVGPIPDGLELDHLCRNRACCNPEHLEPVTHQENMRRSVSPVAHNARKTECSAGHEFTEENTYSYRGQRHCRKCRATSARRRRSA